MKDQWRGLQGASMNELVRKLEAQAESDGIVSMVGGAIITNKRGAVLLVKRTSSDFMPNIVELPSGGVEKGESLMEGIKREVKEEVGLEVGDILSYVGSFDFLSQSGKSKRQFNFHVAGTFSDGQVQLSEEHVGHYWVDSDTLPNFNVSLETQDILREFWEKK